MCLNKIICVEYPNLIPDLIVTPMNLVWISLSTCLCPVTDVFVVLHRVIAETVKLRNVF